MVQSYYEDSSVSEAGSMGRIGETAASIGRGLASVGNVVNGLTPFGVNITTALAGSAAVPFTAASIPVIAPVLGAVTALGGVVKGVSDMTNGRRQKGIKEVLKGLSEGAFVATGALVLMAAFAPGPGGLMLAAGEIISKVTTGKTLTAHFGNTVGNVLDSAMGTEESPQRGNVNVMQAQGMGMQQQMGMAPQMVMPQPSYGQMMAPGGMPYSAVQAGVGMPQMAMAQQPPATYWQDYVAPQRSAQAQEPVTLSGAEAGRYSEAVEAARDAAATNPELANR